MLSSLRLGSLVVSVATACLAQQWEIGGLGGGSFMTHATVDAAAGSATAGFQPGAAVGCFAGNFGERFGGEVRYLFLQSGLKLSSAGSQATFGGAAHIIHYDFIVHPKRREGAIMPYLAGGAGVKVFRGTGQETAYQPLQQFAFLTKTQQVVPLISVGGGIKVSLRSKMLLRAELRDYITPFPTKVIAPVPPAKIGGWLHDFVPLVGISFAF